MKKINVAIDGPAASGKSSISKNIADKLNFLYINTGLVYRSFAYLLKIHNYEINSSLVNKLKKHEIQLLKNEITLIDGKKEFENLRKEEIGILASKISSIIEIRKYAVKIQQKASSKGNVIMDGRDTTFRILPNAQVKIYLDSSSEIRANRRYLQLKGTKNESKYDDILKQIKTRDFRDKNREIDPLHISKDSIYIDSSNISIKEVEKIIYNLIKEAE
ncbi:MAG: (d)CMP kinase [Mollicutes bacterium PWAP]|nr:(d)CMP kinase [Mollicutes bacterium PWAP]